MEYTNLGRTGVKVSRLCLGCMTFGREIDEPASQPIIQCALDQGVNFFDTANVYGNGASESIVGRALKGVRQSIVLATKVYGQMGPGVNDRGLSRVHIMRAIEDSLRRLQTDYVDLYQVHRWDDDTPVDETLRALDDLITQGKVRYIGCSNFAGWQLIKALWTSDKHGWARFESVQPPYSLVRREIEQELLLACADQTVGVIPYSPLAGGFLSGKYRRGAEIPEGTRFDVAKFYQDIYMKDASWRVVDALSAYAAEHGTPKEVLAIAWVASHPTVTAPIIGARTVAQLEQGLAAVTLARQLTPDKRAEITRLADEG
ncbi:MAG: aldo/keto reductase [Chloroflexi bacterium]|nr:MAG: aldo/keto reductase [Chloroflexota bacterium]